MSTRPEPADLAALRRRTSAKWRTYPDDVLPLFVAEMDFDIAPVVADALHRQIDAADLGYVGDPGTLGTDFAGFAARRWGWDVDPAQVTSTTDVSVVIVEALRVVLAEQPTRTGVVIMPPIYPPFFELVPEAGGTVVEVDLISAAPGWRMDLPGIEAALAAGARAVLLCHPHNPLGLVHPPADLERLAELASRHDAVVISDEIHAPLVHRAETFTPFLAVSPTAREVGVAAHSGSKAFNLAGAKCALAVTASPRMRELIARQPEEVLLRTSILGRAATEAAFAAGDDWLDGTVEVIGESLALLETLLADRVPLVRLHRPAASYLAWLDFRATGLGDDPAGPILREGRVALHRGPAFGAPGAGFARLNFGSGPEVLTEAIDRIATVVDAH